MSKNRMINEANSTFFCSGGKLDLLGIRYFQKIGDIFWIHHSHIVNWWLKQRKCLWEVIYHNKSFSSKRLVHLVFMIDSVSGVIYLRYVQQNLQLNLPLANNQSTHASNHCVTDGSGLEGSEIWKRNLVNFFLFVFGTRWKDCVHFLGWY